MVKPRGPPDIETIIAQSKDFPDFVHRARTAYKWSKYELGKRMYPEGNPRSWGGYVYNVEARLLPVSPGSPKFVAGVCRVFSIPYESLLPLISKSLLKPYYVELKKQKIPRN